MSLAQMFTSIMQIPKRADSGARSGGGLHTPILCCQGQIRLTAVSPVERAVQSIIRFPEVCAPEPSGRLEGREEQ